MSSSKNAKGVKRATPLMLFLLLTITTDVISFSIPRQRRVGEGWVINGIPMTIDHVAFNKHRQVFPETDNAAFYKYPDMDILNNVGPDERPDVANVNDLIDTVKPPIASAEPIVIDDIEVNLRSPPPLSSPRPPTPPPPSLPVLSLDNIHESVFGMEESAKAHEEQAVLNVGQETTEKELYLKTQESVDEKVFIPLVDVKTIKGNSQAEDEDQVNIEVNDDEVPIRGVKTNNSGVELAPLPSDEVTKVAQVGTEDDWAESKEVFDYEQGAPAGKEGVKHINAKHDDDVLYADSDEEAVDGVHEGREGVKGDQDEVGGGVIQGEEEVSSGDGDHDDVVLHIDSEQELGLDLERNDHVGAKEGDGDHADSDEEISLGGLEDQEGVEDGNGNHHGDLPYAESDGVVQGKEGAKDNDEGHDDDLLHADSHEVGDGVLEGSGDVKDSDEDHHDDTLDDGVSIGSE